MNDTTKTEAILKDVAAMIQEAKAQVNGSAIKAFTPIFLERAFPSHVSVTVFAERGNEKLVFTNPSMDTLGRLNSVGFTIKVELSEFDTCRAMSFVVKATDMASLEFPVYPSLIIDLGGDDLLLVWQFAGSIDRAQHPALWRVKDVLAKVIAKAVNGKVTGSTIPFPGFFFKRHAVRVLRYGQQYGLDMLIDSFEATDAIRAELAPAPTPSAEEVLNQIVADVLATGITFSADVFASPIAATRMLAIRLRDAGLDDDARKAITPSVHALLTSSEPAWGSEHLEGMIAQVLDVPEVVPVPPKKPRKAATKAATKKANA